MSDIPRKEKTRNLSFCEIPKVIVKKAPTDWSGQLLSGLGSSFHWGDCYNIPALSAGTFSLLEEAGCSFVQSPSNVQCSFDVFRPVYIAIKREEAIDLCIEHRAFNEKMTADFDPLNRATWSKLDFGVHAYFENANTELFEKGKILDLWHWFDLAFNGYGWLEGGGNNAKESSPRLFGLDSLAAFLRTMGTICHESVFDLTWRFPMALASFMIAHNAIANSRDYKMIRPVDRSHIDRLRKYQVETETKGRLLFWQKAFPLEDGAMWDLSSMQLANGGQELVRSFNAIREEVKALSPEERKTRAKRIIDEEGVL